MSIVVKIAIPNGSMFSSPTSPKYFCMELVLSVNLGPTRCVKRTYKWSSILRPRQVLQLYICNHLYSVSAKGTKTKLSPSIVVTLHCSAAKKSLFQQSPPHLCTMGPKVIFKLHTTGNVLRDIFSFYPLCEALGPKKELPIFLKTLTVCSKEPIT